jgi:uncharacterized membrane protein YraQ (UPF0718 family)
LRVPSSTIAHGNAIAATLGSIALDFACIVLAAMPFVVAGALSAAALKRFKGRSMWCAAVVAFATGCDCSLNGMAPALRRLRPSTACIILTLAAACNPVALAATWAIFGWRRTVIRVIAALLTAALAAPAWRFLVARSPHAGQCCSLERLGALDHALHGLRGIATGAFAAALLLAVRPQALHRISSVPAAMIAGALLSPCSSSDAVLAAALLHDGSSQSAFMLAAQCADVRQLSLLRRCFGTMHAFLLAGATCAAAALIAWLG